MADTPTCAAMACDSEIGKRYAFEPFALAATLRSALSAGGELFVAEVGEAEIDAELAGFAWIDPRGAFSSAPYLRLIATAPTFRSFGVGSTLLAEFESRTISVGRDWCLLVSDFNTRAQAFYERHGYRKVGELPDFARAGITEIIMVKRNKGLDA